jgi:nitrogenase-stabilizing/protective protein
VTAPAEERAGGAGTALPELEGLESAEDFFAALRVPFDARVLAVSRLHVMRRFGRAMDELLRGGRGASEAETREALRGALRDAHATFERATPLEEGDFGVLRAARPVRLGRRG